MAKNKEYEALYKAEGKRRMVERKKLRIENLINKQQYRRRYGHWPDSDSPTGYSQLCDYQPLGSFGDSTCQYPCNGDC